MMEWGIDKKSLEDCDKCWGNLTLPSLSLSPDYEGDYEYYNNQLSRMWPALLIIFTPPNKEIFLQIILASKGVNCKLSWWSFSLLIS